MDARSSAFAFAVTVVVVTAALSVVVAARPLRHTDYETLALAVAPASSEGVSGSGGDMVLGAAKWLPMTGGVHFPALPAGASMPWVAGAPPALAGPGGALVPPYVGATRQEQIGMWASLFNPLQRARLPAVSDAADGQTKMPVGGEGSEVDLPAGSVQVGEPKWGMFLRNSGN